jgi:N-acetylmuramoyl-L-alanine amidase
MRPPLRLIPGFLPIALLIVAVAGLLSSPAGAQEGAAAGGPVQIRVAPAVAPDSVAVTLTFSRPVAYRYEETRSRLRLWVEGPVDSGSLDDREIDSDIVRRVRFDEGSRGTTIIFHLGRRFATFTSDEHRDPFRVVVTFLAEGEGVPAERPPLPGAGPGAQEPPGDPGRPGSAAPPGTPGDTGAPGSGTAGPGLGMPETTEPLRRVVIDPGHGGREEGAVSPGGLKEKDLVLDIAQRLRDRLRAAGYAAALTREDDQAMDLESRAAVANRLKADIFLSIHANASMRAAAHGAETYFLSYGSAGATDAEAMRLARLENISPGGSGTASGGRGTDLDVVLWEMAQAEHLTSSSRLAGLIQGELNGVGGTADRGVKQAPFRVLVGAAMPAALVEVGFLTHQEDEKLLGTADHRDRIASALAAAVERFRQERLGAAGLRP